VTGGLVQGKGGKRIEPHPRKEKKTRMFTFLCGRGCDLGRKWGGGGEMYRRVGRGPDEEVEDLPVLGSLFSFP